MAPHPIDYETAQARIGVLETALREAGVDVPDERPSPSVPASESVQESWTLCGYCGEISPDAEWKAVRYEEDGEVNWVPDPDCDSDPLLLCPRCNYRHTDDDGNAGIWIGSYEEMERERRDNKEYFDDWGSVPVWPAPADSLPERSDQRSEGSEETDPARAALVETTEGERGSIRGGSGGQYANTIPTDKGPCSSPERRVHILGVYDSAAGVEGHGESPSESVSVTTGPVYRLCKCCTEHQGGSTEPDTVPDRWLWPPIACRDCGELCCCQGCQAEHDRDMSPGVVLPPETDERAMPWDREIPQSSARNFYKRAIESEGRVEELQAEVAKLTEQLDDMEAGDHDWFKMRAERDAAQAENERLERSEFAMEDRAIIAEARAEKAWQAAVDAGRPLDPVLAASVLFRASREVEFPMPEAFREWLQFSDALTGRGYGVTQKRSQDD